MPSGDQDAVRSTVALIPIICASAAVSLAQGKPVGRAEVIQQLQNGNNQAALSFAEEALKAAPRDCALLSLSAIAQTGLHQQERALASFQKALTFCPAYLPALEGVAQIRYAQGSTEAAPLLRRILALKPEDPTANAMLATTLRKEGSCADALGHFEASKPLFPSRPDLVEAYATCLADIGDLPSALAQYLHLLASNPNDTIRYNVALLQWKTHANDDALASLAPLLTGSHQVPALALASKLHEEEGETPEAVALLREAILSTPDNVDNYLDFAAIAFAHKSFQVGIDMLNAGLKRLPNSAALHVARGVLEVQLSMSDVAIADFEHAHKLDPKMSFALDAVGIMQSQQHQNGESLNLFEKQAKEHPDDPLLQYLLAEQLSQAFVDTNGAKLNAAIAAAKRAANLDPGYQAAHDLLAVLYVRTKQPQLAIQEAELALASDPEDVSALYQELMAKRSSGDTKEIKALTLKLEKARKVAAQRQQSIDRYQLQGGIER